MWFSMLQIDITDVGNEFNVWSIFGEFDAMSDIHVTNKDVIVNVSDPRHTSFGRRLLMPSNVHGMLIQGLFVIVTQSVCFTLILTLSSPHLNNKRFRYGRETCTMLSII